MNNTGSDDGSKDRTLEISAELGIKGYRNQRKHGYGSNAKNCFNKALENKADIVVILHSDNQYDPTKIPQLVKPITSGDADFTIGSRILGDNAEGMSAFRFIGNRALGFVENLAMGTKLTDLHSGLIAVRADLLRQIPFNKGSDDFGFHTDIVFQSQFAGARFKETGVPTRYDDTSSSISVYRSILYGFRALYTTLIFLICRLGIEHPLFRISRGS